MSFYAFMFNIVLEERAKHEVYKKRKNKGKIYHYLHEVLTIHYCYY